MRSETTEPTHFDVLIVGAGLSGIGAACRLRMHCPGKTFAVLEGRDRMGGTWDLFRYPGIRSDSDMYTLGYPFRPWTGKAIADGPSILEYIHETAREYDVERTIRYRHQVVGARWSSDDARWTIDARETSSGHLVQLTCSFLYMCAGYYEYEHGYTPDFPGRERFRGEIVHPQHWSEDLDYDEKRVVVVGSGATAITLVPSLAERAAHVTMLQRSPSYVLAIPGYDQIAAALERWLPDQLAYSVTRWKNVLLGSALYSFCQRWPERAKRLLMRHAREQLGGEVDVETHFNPDYNPWDQRLCLARDGDFFRALRKGRASIVTDRIDTFTERGIRLRSGTELEADLIITATGLQLKLLGGLELEVDGRHVDPSDTMVYRGTMLSEVPNMAMALGYTNASWTLKCDLTSRYVCRLLQHMDENGYAVCRPRRPDSSVEERPLLDLTSGYIQRSIDQLPRQGSRRPWKLYQSYPLDQILLGRAPFDDGVLQFAPTVRRPDDEAGPGLRRGGPRLHTPQ